MQELGSNEATGGFCTERDKIYLLSFWDPSASHAENRLRAGRAETGRLASRQETGAAWTLFLVACQHLIGEFSNAQRTLSTVHVRSD